KKEALERIDEMMEKEEKEISWSDSLVDRLDKKAWARKLEPQLERACLNIRPTEYGALLLLAFGVIGYLIKWVLETSIWLGLLNSLVLTPIASRMFLKSRKHVYTRRIDAQLPEACRLLSSAARAGLSIPQGLEIVVQETPAPIKNELGTVVR